MLIYEEREKISSPAPCGIGSSMDCSKHLDQYLNHSGMTLTISSTSSSENSQSFGLARVPRSGSNKALPAPVQILGEAGLTVFTFTQLKAATNNFGAEALLGEGGFGEVFKGSIDERATSGSRKSIIAVKKLKQGSIQGFNEWQKEIIFLGRLSHPNIAKLLGYCYEDEQLLLVYEFASKGSLNNHLFGRGSVAHPLPWDTRLKIAVGAACGLAFLHTCEKKIIYRDVKTANILLDGSYTAKLSDFGLARFGPSEGQSHVTTRIMGTFGYAAPEYIATGHLFIKSDVYGFGVVLLELLMGRQVIDKNCPAKKQNLVTWSKHRLPQKRNLVAMMDPKLEGKYPLEAATAVAQLALKCVHAHPDHRPSMTEVVEELQKIEAASAGSNYH